MIVIIWFLFTLLYVVFLAINEITSAFVLGSVISVICDYLAFTCCLLRNLSCALIAYYYSIHLPKLEYDKTKIDESE